MPENVLHSPLLLCLLAVAVSAIGSLLPFSPAEPLLVGIAAAAPRSLLLPLVLLATASSMGAKTLVYLGWRNAPRALGPRQRATVDRVNARLAGRRSLQCAAVCLSGAASVPPFYLVTALCGAMRLPLRDFLVAGTAGRALRFAVLMLLPHLAGVAR